MINKQELYSEVKMNNVIEVSGLEFSYGRKEVLKGVELHVPRGSVFGFLGRNGAGKTTLIKTLLGLQKPKAGKCSINGLDSFKQAIEIRRQIGFMAEDQQMYGWMKIGQIIKWVAGFYKGWDYEFSDRLLEIFGLDKNTKVKNLSKGQNSKLALLLAIGYKPDIVILDDPTLGLDPIARKEFIRYVIEFMQGEGVTVFFSSHLLYEIEPVCDYVAILEDGRIIRTDSTENLRRSVKKFMLRSNEYQSLTDIENLLDLEVSNDSVIATFDNCGDQLRQRLVALDPQMREVDLNLDEIFEAYTCGNRGESIAAAV